MPGVRLWHQAVVHAFICCTTLQRHQQSHDHTRQQLLTSALLFGNLAGLLQLLEASAYLSADDLNDAGKSPDALELDCKTEGPIYWMLARSLLGVLVGVLGQSCVATISAERRIPVPLCATTCASYFEVYFSTGLCRVPSRARA
jgi:hypothetical protein